jgi:UDP-GlcNAc:undecaprenyl-phosphate/decaprenyl-phosphate GlcNAc-1-phosphate transferase
LITFALAFTLAAVLTPLAAKMATALNAVAAPNHQRWHRGATTPKLGGIGIYLTFMVLAAAIPWQWGMGLTIIFLAGLRDDFRPLSIASKLTSQGLGAVVALTSIITIPDQALLAITAIFWVLFCVNAYNMLDNMDGTAVATAFIVSLVLGLFAWKIGLVAAYAGAFALSGATLGFFFFNYSPARIFLGDNGSHFVGAALAIIAFALWEAVGLSLLIVFAVPIADFLYVTIKRVLAGRKPYVGGRDHLAHDLYRSGLSERQISGLYLVTNAICGAFAWIVARL